MNILMVISTKIPPEEGIGHHAYYLSKELIKLGHRVTVITRGGLKTQFDQLEGINIVRIPFIPIYPFHIVFEEFVINQFIKKREHEFDICHIHTPLSPIVNFSKPIITTIHTSIIEDAKHLEIVDAKSIVTILWTKVFAKRYMKKIIKKSKICISVSNSVSRELEKYFDYSDSIIITNAVDSENIVPIQEKNPNRYALFVGRLSYRKGLLDLLDAAKIFCKKNDIKLYIIGKGEMEETIRDKIKANNLEKDVEMLGFVDREKLITYYQNATIFILPSHYESGPLVMYEAMACGVPIISTDVGTAPEIITHMENGILVPIKNPQKIAEAVQILLDNPELRKKIGANARTLIEQGYSWSNTAKRIEKIYQNLVEENQ